LFHMDIDLLREQPEKVRDSQRRRYASETLVDVVLALDKTWREVAYKVKEMRTRINKLNDEMKVFYQKKEQPPEALKTAKADLEARIKKEEAQETELKTLLDDKLGQIGNMVHPDVVVSKNEDLNPTVAKWGTNRAHTDDMLHHHELLYRIGGYEPEAGSKIAGSRGYFLTGPGVLLNQAIINYAIEFLRRRDFLVMQTPFFMVKEVMARTAQLSDFDEQLYKVTDGEGEKYLIATSEQPISAFNMEKNIPKGDLPIKYAGYSTNFRKEAGGYGRDVWGIFRVHQFEKIEQFVITAPDKSWEMHKNLIQNSEEFFQSLGIAYRVVDIVSGELNDAAARKYDLEGWFPCLNEYRELVSCSNCTDYQSRKLDIKYGFKNEEKEGEGKYVHMLNSTLAATSRVICVILETFQTDKGIEVPAALHPYLPESMKFIPFIREVPERMDVKKQAAVQAVKSKGKGKAQ